MDAQFYSLSNSFYFIILCYIEQKIYLFLWRDAISRFKFQKKFRPAGDCGHLKVRTLKVNKSDISLEYHGHVHKSGDKDCTITL
jgi:hypothetical protein